MKTNRLTVGILAHVDAGKTTLSECILYETGAIGRRGRVDHKDAYLDTYELEKARGITIFSKQAEVQWKDYQLSLLDTPGHVDFSAEMERTLRVLDYAILVINGADGVQGHTLTVWRLLRRYHVPTFIFVNKMDLISANREKLLDELQKRVDENCIDFGITDAHILWDQLAVCDEMLMEVYLDSEKMDSASIQQAIARRHVFPVYFGSALKNEGVREFLDGIGRYMRPKSYPDIFGARVFKVSRDQQGERLTYVKVTGGSLKVKSLLTNRHQRNVELSEEEFQHVWQGKVDQIRIYSGNTYEMIKEAQAGAVCALTGLSETKPGDGLGFEHQSDAPELVPVLGYKVEFPEGTNIYTMLKNLRLLEEEEPHLNVLWNEQLSEVHVRVMGEIQTEVLRSTIMERFGVDVSFGKGSLVYRETIRGAVVGAGHFEPLKHYAEVHLLMEPLENGSGLVLGSNCSEDLMDRNWQRLVLSHLAERRHPGVLTGSELTDMRITLVAGKGHIKHTEGGDFRQAAFRALRQGLMKGENQLLEPVYDFTLELPKEMLGRGMSDIERMYGRYSDPVIEKDHIIINGTAPVATMMHYGTEVMVYTKGQGRLDLSLSGYEPCHNQEEVIAAMKYDPEKDLQNPAGSVFCSKGVGYSVSWEEADSHMHVDSGIRFEKTAAINAADDLMMRNNKGSDGDSDRELAAIFEKTYGPQKKRMPGGGTRIFDQRDSAGTDREKNRKITALREEKIKYLLVDGYNIIFAWDELKELAAENLDAARGRLAEMLSNYQGQTEETVILVFDAYRVTGGQGDITPYNNIYIVYTKEAETADQYIEKLVHAIRPNHEVTVATSDVVEQVIILGKGARRLSAEGLKIEMTHLENESRHFYKAKVKDEKNRPFDKLL